MELSKCRIPVITGPTATGKTGVSLIMAERVPCEVINMDSRQVYRGMDIGTAKPSREEMDRVPHHLIDVVDPGKRFTVADFVDKCRIIIEEIRARGRLPVIVGGTSFYLSALLGELDFCDVDRDEEFRRRMRARAEAEGKENIHAELAQADPASAARIHPNDLFRVIRALEIYHITGAPASGRRPKRVPTAGGGENCVEDFYISALYMERKKLYHLIDKRAELMFHGGLPEEAEEVARRWPYAVDFLNKTIGYGQALRVTRGEMSLEEAVGETAKHTRRYAKRQLTWFKSMAGLHWFDRDSLPAEHIAGNILETIESQTIKN